MGGQGGRTYRVSGQGVPGYGIDLGIARAQPMGYTLVPGPINSQNVPSFLIDPCFNEVSQTVYLI